MTRQNFGRMVCAALLLASMVFLSGCGQQENASSTIAGEWYQSYQGGQKILTIPATCDTYSIACPDGTVVSGAIFQDSAVADEENAYVFYFDEPSVISSDPATNKMNYRNMNHQIMYLFAGDESSSGNNSATEVLEGYTDTNGRATVLDGAWLR